MTVERNTDKIKRLEYELERCRQKVDRQEAELAQLRPNAKTALDGLAAAHATMNANMAVLAMWYGQKEEDGYLIRVTVETPE